MTDDELTALHHEIAEILTLKKRVQEMEADKYEAAKQTICDVARITELRAQLLIKEAEFHLPENPSL